MVVKSKFENSNYGLALFWGKKAQICPFFENSQYGFAPLFFGKKSHGMIELVAMFVNVSVNDSGYCRRFSTQCLWVNHGIICHLP